MKLLALARNWVLLFSLIPSLCFADSGLSGGGVFSRSISEVTDGTNTCYPYAIKVGTNSCTNGVATISTSGGSGTNYWLTNGNNGIGTYAPTNVGIGTISPIQTLQVNGTVYLNGNVGIGSTVPGKQLDVNGTIRTTNLTIPGATTNYVLTASDSSGDVTWSAGAGNVGVGTANDVTTWGASNTLNASNGFVYVGGNVGLSSTVPGQTLDVSGTIRTTNFNLIPPASTFPTTSVLDTFTRSNSGSLGGNWTNSNNVTWGNDTLGINGNATNDSSGANGGSAFWNVTSFSGKIEAYVTVSNAGTSDPVGLICASSTSSYQGYWVRSDGSGHIQLVKASSGTAVSLHNFTQTVSSGDSIGFSLDTSGNFTIYYKSGSGAWTTVGTYNDTSYSCSYIGIQLTDTVMRLTNFAGGTSGSAGSVNGDVLTTDANGNGTWQAVSNYWSRTAPYTYLANSTDNVGIGSSTPGQTLDVNGTIRATGTSPIVLGSDNNSYIVASSSTNAALQFSTNSQTRATITNAGNIGIGSASPGKLLDVAGSLRTTSFTLPGNNAQSTYVLTATDSSGDTTWSAAGGGSSQWTGTSPGAVYYAPGGTAGNVGIGSTVPGTTLDVQGTIRTSVGLSIGSAALSSIYDLAGANFHVVHSTGRYSGPYTTNSGNSVLNEDGSGFFAGGNINITAGGVFTVTGQGANVGIGSTVPGDSLDVQGTIRTTNFTYSGNNATTNYILTASDSSGDATWSASPGSGTVNTGTAGQVAYYPSSTTTVGPNSHMVFSGSNVGIGSTVPGATLDVSGTIRGTQLTLNASNIVTDTTTGMKIGTATGQKLGFFNQSPVSQPSGDALTALGTSSGLGLISSPTLTSSDVGLGNVTNNAQVTSVTGTSPLQSSGGLTPAISIIGSTGTGTNFVLNGGYPNFTGNVGLGSTAPGATLDVQGSVRITPPVGTNLALITTGNIGIGSNAPGDTLDVVGTLRMTHFTYSGNSATTNYVLTATDSSGDANWQAATGGSSQWTGTSGGPIYYSPVSTNANVGIGSTVPGETLDVYGTFRVVGNLGIGAVPTNPMTVVASGQQMASWTSTNNTQPYILIGNQSDGASMLFGEVNGGDGFFQSHDSAHKIQIQTSGNGLGALVSANVGINTTTVQTALSVAYGNVGIDTWSPGAELQVNSTIGMFVVTGAGNVGIGTQAPLGSLTVTNGNVGIGTFSPIDILDINGTGGAAVVVSSGGNVGIGTITTQVPLTVMSGNVGVGTISPIAGVQVSTTGNAYFGGNVGIGSLNPFNSLVVQNGIRAVGIGTTAVQILCVNNLHQVGVMSSGATGTCTVNTN